jgi:hypothetical protein
MPDDGITRQAESFRKGDHIFRLRIQAVIKISGGFRQTAATDIDNVYVERVAECLSDKAPCDRRARDARKQNDRIAVGAYAAITQIMLAHAISVDVGAI